MPDRAALDLAWQLRAARCHRRVLFADGAVRCNDLRHAYRINGCLGPSCRCERGLCPDPPRELNG